VRSFLIVEEGAGEGAGWVGFVAHADPFVEHCLCFFFGAGHFDVDVDCIDDDDMLYDVYVFE